jgi:hypothetical protein
MGKAYETSVGEPEEKGPLRRALLEEMKMLDIVFVTVLWHIIILRVNITNAFLG